MSKFVDYFKTFNMKKLFFILITIVLLFLIISNIILLCIAFPLPIKLKCFNNQEFPGYYFDYKGTAPIFYDEIKVEVSFKEIFPYNSVITYHSSPEMPLLYGGRVGISFINPITKELITTFPNSVKVFINNKLYAVYKS